MYYLKGTHLIFSALFSSIYSFPPLNQEQLQVEMLGSLSYCAMIQKAAMLYKIIVVVHTVNLRGLSVIQVIQVAEDFFKKWFFTPSCEAALRLLNQ